MNVNSKLFWKQVGNKKAGKVEICSRVKDGNEIHIGRAEVEVRVGKLKNGKAASKDEITGKMKKGGGDKVVDWIWRLCNIVFESCVVPENWRSAVIVPLYKDK